MQEAGFRYPLHRLHMNRCRFYALCFYGFLKSTMHKETCRLYPDGTPQSPSAMSSLLLRKARLSVTMLILL
jgi:hypothetical protein